MSARTASQREAFGQLSGRDERIQAYATRLANESSAYDEGREVGFGEGYIEGRAHRWPVLAVLCAVVFLAGYVAGVVL